MSSFSVFRLSFIGMFLAVLTATQGGLSADEGDQYKSFKDCLTISDKSVRFVCYEAFARGGVFSVKKVEIEQKKSFGTEKKSPIDAMEKMTVTVEAVKKTALGKLVFTTSDGQIWKQTNSGRFIKPKLPFEAVIKKRMISGYMLSPVGSNKTVAVKRIK